MTVITHQSSLPVIYIIYIIYYIYKVLGSSLQLHIGIFSPIINVYNLGS